MKEIVSVIARGVVVLFAACIFLGIVIFMIACLNTWGLLGLIPVAIVIAIAARVAKKFA